MIDEIDKKILSLLQTNARLSNAEIAESVGLNASSVFERVKKLERKGVITGYVATVDAEKLGKPLLAFIRVSVSIDSQKDIDSTREEMTHAFQNEPDVLEVHHVAGEDCYIVKVRAAGPKDLERLLIRIRVMTHSVRSVTSIVLSTDKELIKIEPYHDNETNE